jgi:hypothetical protein
MPGKPVQFLLRRTGYGYFRCFWQEGIWSTIQTTLLLAAKAIASRSRLLRMDFPLSPKAISTANVA